MSAKQKGRPRNIFDLPLELRQQIYRECIPEQREYRIKDDTVDNVEGLQFAHPSIAKEFEEEQLRICDLMRFVVTPKAWKAPPPIQSSKVYTIYVYFAAHTHEGCVHVDDCPCTTDCAISQRDHDQLWTMQPNCHAFVSWVNQSHLSVTHLSMNDRGYDDTDLHWCEAHVTGEGELVKYSMAVAEGASRPIYEVLLKPFLRFPVVETAVCRDLGSVSDWEELEGHEIATLYAGEYMWSFGAAWEE